MTISRALEWRRICFAARPSPCMGRCPPSRAGWSHHWASSAITSETLARALAAVPLELGDLDPWVSFGARIPSQQHAEAAPLRLRVLCWLPGQRTSLHAHGHSACAFRVVAGTSTEIRLGQPDACWEPGAVIAEGSPGLVHQITNLGREPLVSLHAYAPALPIDQPPSTYEGRHVVIVGGGVSGVALAIHLLRPASGTMRVSIVERRPSLGRGPAYGTSDPALRLNVPAERMSVLPERPNDFVEWARDGGTTVGAGALLPRHLFGSYVEARLADAIADGRGKLWFHRSEAVAAAADGVTLADGTFLRADAVVLATGNQLPAGSRGAIVRAAAFAMGHRRSVERWFAGPHRGGRGALLVGSGLTAVDVLLALRNQGHRGRIFVTSRHGLLPRPHRTRGARPCIRGARPQKLPRSVLGLCRHLRAEVQRAELAGIPWQRVIDALRPHTTAVWRSLPLAEKHAFMAKVRPFWEVLRHRAAADSLAVIEALRADRQVLLVPGRIAAIREESGLVVELMPRGETTIRRLRCDRLIFARGRRRTCAPGPGRCFGTCSRRGAAARSARTRGHDRRERSGDRRARDIIASGCSRSERCDALTCGRRQRCPTSCARPPPSRTCWLSSRCEEEAVRADARADGRTTGRRASHRGPRMLCASWIWPRLSGERSTTIVDRTRLRLRAERRARFFGLIEVEPIPWLTSP
ncbi:MAG: FAD/NAD(P)-binding protein [Nannocystis sp.]|uniref:FAD/NAD(P)-binding protein n=1 Tax=Nannocystis sp. TaxID=1962667 RepID=UPI002429C743|nr:FAD/NAD(P)-binding protein [Nannocystis sp.]MBK9756014.1 FAD/NAD(P)-binding protein [Nannocystis sp.]